MFTSILGNSFVKSYLETALAAKTLPHALLFSGIDGIGKSLFARALAARLLQAPLESIASETHPDLHVQRPEGKSALHTIEGLRHWMEEVHRAPFGSSGKVFLLYDAHRMQPAAANSLLKTLEEPSQDTTMILVTDSLQDMLPTILSRCALIRFLPLQQEEVATILKQRGVSEQFARFGHGSAGRALALAQEAPWQDLLEGLCAECLFHSSLSASLSDAPEKIEKEMETDDPLQYHLRAERVFAFILMRCRDVLAQRYAQPPLLSKEIPPFEGELSGLARLQTKVEEARYAFSRNLRLSLCLRHIFTESIFRTN